MIIWISKEAISLFILYQHGLMEMTLDLSELIPVELMKLKSINVLTFHYWKQMFNPDLCFHLACSQPSHV